MDLQDDVLKSLDVRVILNKIAPAWKCTQAMDYKIRMWAIGCVEMVFADLLQEEPKCQEYLRIARQLAHLGDSKPRIKAPAGIEFWPLKASPNDLGKIPLGAWTTAARTTRYNSRKCMRLAVLRTTSRYRATATLAEAVRLCWQGSPCCEKGPHHHWKIVRQVCFERLWKIIGPGQPNSIPGHWLTLPVLQLAQAIQSEQRYNELPVLADALEDAGCDNEAVLRSLRTPPFCEANNVLDLIAYRDRKTA